jgi:division protein CdvB (Snf7/Vps24/ESCRT-III family)
MSTNCRSLDDMNESEAIAYVKHLIEQVQHRLVEQNAYLEHYEQGVRAHTYPLVERYIQLDEAIVEVLQRLIS